MAFLLVLSYRPIPDRNSTARDEKTLRAESAKGLDPLAMWPSPGNRIARVRALVLTASPDRRGDLLPLASPMLEEQSVSVNI